MGQVIDYFIEWTLGWWENLSYVAQSSVTALSITVSLFALLMMERTGFLVGRPKTLRLVILVIPLIFFLLFLILILFSVEDFWPNFSLNLLTELIGAFVTTVLVGWMVKVYRDSVTEQQEAGRKRLEELTEELGRREKRQQELEEEIERLKKASDG